MEDPKATQRLEFDEPEILEALLKQQTREMAAISMGKAREVLLLVENGIRRLELYNETTFLLGRFSKATPRGKHVDLSPFNAQEKGVSRIHAQIHMDDNKLYITDMDSTNGTLVDGVRLQAHHPQLLRQGSQIVLGRLSMQIMYKAQQESTSAGASIPASRAEVSPTSTTTSETAKAD
jgi:pSer/pThr/pTyr-binding forkhead associated (FHA) protein